MEPQNLVFIVAIDPPGQSGNRTLAKMLASSLLRTFFTGDILVFRNTTAPLFAVERKGLDEVFVETKAFEDTEDRVIDAWCWKYRVRTMVDPTGYDKVLFLDADCLALRNIDHLLEGDWDIAYQPERGHPLSRQEFSCFLTDDELSLHAGSEGANSGTLAVRGTRFHEVMAEWERIDSGEPARKRFCSDQGSWNKLLLDSELNAVPFPDREVLFPLYQHPLYQEYRKAALVHTLGGDLVEKIQFGFGLYTSTFYCDPSALLLDFMEI